jgi:hypothetical protein
LQDYLQLQHALGESLRAGFLSLAQARYAMGADRVSPLQIPSTLSATARVTTAGELLLRFRLVFSYPHEYAAPRDWWLPFSLNSSFQLNANGRPFGMQLAATSTCCSRSPALLARLPHPTPHPHRTLKTCRQHRPAYQRQRLERFRTVLGRRLHLRWRQVAVLSLLRMAWSSSCSSCAWQQNRTTRATI